MKATTKAFGVVIILFAIIVVSLARDCKKQVYEVRKQESKSARKAREKPEPYILGLPSLESEYPCFFLHNDDVNYFFLDNHRSNRYNYGNTVILYYEGVEL
jgi:hypothetical protein